MQTLTARPALIPSHFASTLPRKIVVGVAATAAVAAAAHISVPLPFTPVPLTLQPLAVLGVGLLLGPVAGCLTMLAYLAEGAIGLPVFAPGLGGIAQLFGPTGGFLMAYPLVAAIAGGIARVLQGKAKSFIAAFAGTAIATLVLFALGAGWLMHLLHLTIHQTWIAGVAPFLPGGVVDVVVASGVYAALVRPARIQ
jgi:biotin transport system substrate-specific component